MFAIAILTFCSLVISIAAVVIAVKAEAELIVALAELDSAKKERTLCEAEISHLQVKRDSRGRFTK